MKQQHLIRREDNSFWTLMSHGDPEIKNGHVVWTPLGIEIAEQMVRELEEAALAPCTVWQCQPENNADARQWIAWSKAWGARVAKCYGHAKVSKTTEGPMGQGLVGFFSVGGEPLENPVSVLGSLPPWLTSGCGSELFAAVDDITKSFHDLSIEARKNPSKYWAHYHAVLWATYLSVRARALELVAWVRQRIEHYNEARLPRVEIHEERGDRKRSITVILGGRAKRYVIQESQSQLLEQLATKDKTEATKSVVSALKKKVPELDGLIVAINNNRLRGKKKTNARNYVVYQLVPEMRDRISLSYRTQPAQRTASEPRQPR